jgi:hypothetical protein
MHELFASQPNMQYEFYMIKINDITNQQTCNG